MRCSACKDDKAVSDFGSHRGTKSGRNGMCRPCAAEASRRSYAKHRAARCAQSKRWRVENPAKLKAIHRRMSLRKNYGMTVEEHDELMIYQGGACAVCTTAMTQPFVDHDHATGAVRGLVCRHCNSMLGYARDNPEILANAITYLARHSAPRSTMKVA